MSKTLVIKGANFNTNKIDTIVFEDIPCTGIELNQTALTLDTVGRSSSLSVTKTPSNATDPVQWATSNAGVATVASGMITPLAEGTATITVTCGAVSASCAVTVEFTKECAKNVLMSVLLNGTTSIREYAQAQGATGIKPATLGVPSGTYPAFGAGETYSEGLLADIYPIPIPSGCTGIKVTCENLAPIIIYYSRDVDAKVSVPALYRSCAFVPWGEIPSGNTEWSINSWEYGGRTFTIPDVNGIDGFTLSFNANSSTVLENFTANDVTIEYLFD